MADFFKTKLHKFKKRGYSFHFSFVSSACRQQLHVTKLLIIQTVIFTALLVYNNVFWYKMEHPVLVVINRHFWRKTIITIQRQEHQQIPSNRHSLIHQNTSVFKASVLCRKLWEEKSKLIFGQLCLHSDFHCFFV